MVQIAAKQNAKKQTIDEGQEIRDLLVKLGYREITAEDEKTDWYKFLSKKPDCFNKP
jgi:hypothetical protein